jgi:3-oxoacyl-[acyl-carrier protein] reductase
LDLGLKDRAALVAGSSRGIGQAIAHHLLEEGCCVCITGRDPAALAKTRLQFEDEFGPDRLLAFEGDLTNPAIIQKALAAIQEKWSRLDCVVANIGSGRGKPGWDLADADWEQLLSQNFTGSVRLVQAAIPLLIAGHGGSVVFLSSITGVESTAAPLPYSAAKAALVSYSKNLSRLVAEFGIRVNCVAPGNVLFAGGSWEKHLRDRRDAVMQMIEREVPMHRFGRPQEISDLVVFLCSQRASFITGGCFIADGGQTRSM